jgi:nitric oxide reductase NorQ protein
MPDPAGTPSRRAAARPGELRRTVAAWLSAHPGPHTVREIAEDLGHSGGAVDQALKALVALSEADPAGTSPKRYKANAKTAAAAGRTVPPPGSPRERTPGSQRKTAAAGHRDRHPYHPRRLAGITDVEALQRLAAAGVPVLLYGPPGTGKTALAEAAFPDLITISGDGDTTTADLIGDYTQNPDGTFKFIYGPLVRAMKQGRKLFIDDATLISPAVLAGVYPALDGRGEVTVKAHEGEVITAAPGFYVIAGHNPGVHGAILTEALSSRFSVQIEVPTDYDLAADIGIDARVVGVARELDRMRQKGEIGWAPQFRELLAFRKTAGILGEDAAVSNLAGIAPLEDRDVVKAALEKAYERASVAPLKVGRSAMRAEGPVL